MESIRCSLCLAPGVDVCFSDCSCKVHARCVPWNMILSEEALQRNERRPIAPGELLCPSCQVAPVTSIRLLPLNLDYLEQAVEQRRVIINETKQGNSGGGIKEDGVKLKFQNAPEASLLLLSYAGPTGNLAAANDYQRTGRWTAEERAYTDFLVDSFDAGNLPMPPGIKLAEFLGEILLCKSSRLTKKMKHAKLSRKAYDLRHPVCKLNATKLSKLEQDFIDSSPYEYLKLEFRWHLTRVWRSHLSSLCLQINSKLMDFSDWFKSLQDMEHRAMQAEDVFRKVRLQGLNNVLNQTNKEPSNDIARAVSSSTLVVQPPPAKRIKVDAKKVNRATSGGASVTDASSADDGADDTDHFKPCELDLDNPSIDHHQDDDDYAKILDDLVNGSNTETKTYSFLQEIAQYMESQNQSFVYSDLWTPSPSQDETTGQMPLLHAGFVSRTDIASEVFGKLNEFGNYSSKFSFLAGVGLPGLALQQGKAHWEHNLHEADPRFFEGPGEDKSHGIKSGLGICIPTKETFVVVCLYSYYQIREDPRVATRCFADIAKLCPVPKWTATIEMAPFTLQTGRDNAKTQGLRITEDGGSTKSGLTNSSTQCEDNGAVDLRMASLLGDFMPPLSPTGHALSTEASGDLATSFVSLRLLLLRPLARRSNEENEMLVTIRRSYLQYTRNRRRSAKEVAYLIVKDWQFLCRVMPTLPWTATPPAPRTRTSSSPDLVSAMNTGQLKREANPVVMPHPLAFINPVSLRKRSQSG